MMRPLPLTDPGSTRRWPTGEQAMIDDNIYRVHIDAYSPQTIPMSRLAEYMPIMLVN